MGPLRRWRPAPPGVAPRRFEWPPDCFGGAGSGDIGVSGSSGDRIDVGTTMLLRCFCVGGGVGDEHIDWDAVATLSSLSF